MENEGGTESSDRGCRRCKRDADREGEREGEREREREREIERRSVGVRGERLFFLS